MVRQAKSMVIGGAPVEIEALEKALTSSAAASLFEAADERLWEASSAHGAVFGKVTEVPAARFPAGVLPAGPGGPVPAAPLEGERARLLARVKGLDEGVKELLGRALAGLALVFAGGLVTVASTTGAAILSNVAGALITLLTGAVNTGLVAAAKREVLGFLDLRTTWRLNIIYLRDKVTSAATDAELEGANNEIEAHWEVIRRKKEEKGKKSKR